MADGTIDLAGLPLSAPGPSDTMAGVDESSGAARRFPLGALPVPGMLAIPTGSSKVGFVQDGYGAVPRTALDKLRETVAAEDYKLPADGSDDALSINRAMTAHAGGRISLRHGKTYIIRSPILIPSGTTLDATGSSLTRGASIDNMVRGRNDGSAGGYAANKDITVLGGEWNGNPSTYGGAFTVMAFGHADGVSIRGAVIRNVAEYHHIEISGCRRVEIASCTFYGGAEQQKDNIEAVQIDSDFGGGQWLWGGPSDGTPCDNINIHGCTFSNNGAGVGTHSSVPTTIHRNIRITGNRFLGMYYLGVRSRNWSNVIIDNNHFTGGYGAIVLQAVGVINSKITINGNIIENVGSTSRPGASARAIHVMGESGGVSVANWVTLSDNIIIDTNIPGKTTHALTIDYAKNVAISGNVISNVSRVGIYAFACYDVSVASNVVTGTNQDGAATTEGIIVGSATAGISFRYTCVGNTCTNMRIWNAQQSLVHGNNVSAAGGIIQTGANTGSHVGGNLVNGAFV